MVQFMLDRKESEGRSEAESERNERMHGGNRGRHIHRHGRRPSSSRRPGLQKNKRCDSSILVYFSVDFYSE